MIHAVVAVLCLLFAERDFRRWERARDGLSLAGWVSGLVLAGLNLIYAFLTLGGILR